MGSPGGRLSPPLVTRRKSRWGDAILSNRFRLVTRLCSSSQESLWARLALLYYAGPPSRSSARLTEVSTTLSASSPAPSRSRGQSSGRLQRDADGQGRGGVGS